MCIYYTYRCENLPQTILKNGKQSRDEFICCWTKERDCSREESGGNTDVGGASHRGVGVSGDAVNVQIGGVESAESGSLLGGGGGINM